MPLFSWSSFPFLRVALFLIGGILASIHFSFFDIEILEVIILTLFLLYILIFSIHTKKQKILFHYLYGSIGLVFIFCIGMLLPLHQKAKYNLSFFSRDNQSKSVFYVGKIKSQLEEKKNTFQTIFYINKIYDGNNYLPANGKIILYINKDGQSKKLEYNDELVIKGIPTKITRPANPYQFDYARFMSYQNIYHQHYIKSNQYKLIKKNKSISIEGLAISVREKCTVLLKKILGDGDEYKMTIAIVLGIRNSLDPETKQSYAAAGALHVLAVSGLHVAIVFQILTLLLGKIQKTQNGTIIFTLVAISLLWFYAFVTGFSASVLRAVMMFSFVIIAKSLKKPSNIYNVIGLSACCLLIYNPFFIMDVGFQLSYLAVIGIVFFYPRIEQLITPKLWMIKQIWSISCVTIAAQLATLPLSLFYFHQFPTYGIIANLIIIPLSSLILYLGLVALAIGWVSFFQPYLHFILKWNVWLLNKSAYLTERLPFSIIDRISFFNSHLIIFYSLLILISLLFIYKSFRYVRLLFFVFIIYFFIIVKNNIEIRNQEGLIVYYIKDFTAIEIFNRQKGIVLHDDSTQSLTEINKASTPFENQKNIKARETILLSELKKINWIASHSDKIIDFFIWEGKTIGIVKEINEEKLQAYQKIKFDLLITKEKNKNKIAVIIKMLSIKTLLTQELVEIGNTKTIIHSLSQEGAYMLKK